MPSKCSLQRGDTCAAPSQCGNEIEDNLGCADCNCLTLEEQEELLNLFACCPCGSCKHRDVQGMDCYACEKWYLNWEPRE